MKALTYGGVGRVEVAEVVEPRIRDARDAIVEVDRGAICGSDLHVHRGLEVGIDPGTVLGHECVGRIVAGGDAIARRAIGRRVAVPFSTSCGACYFCTRGLSARCASGHLFGWVQNGVGLEGAQAERVRVPLADTTLFPIGDEVSDEAALLLGDVLPTGDFCAAMAETSEAGTYAVLGCGPVGLMAIAAAHERGARRIHAVDTIPERLAFAERFGAVPVDARVEPPLEAIRRATEGRGVDAVLEAVGSPEAGRMAFEMVRPGGIIAAVGVHHESAFPFSPARAYDHNLTYRIGRCPARSLMQGLLPLVRRRGAELASIFTHRFPLERGAEAYALFDARHDGCVKVALTTATSSR
jgi:threonine dehydrogenase-like Zn-dependent dehydrogenase